MIEESLRAKRKIVSKRGIYNAETIANIAL